jgi:hypothetical protein
MPDFVVFANIDLTKTFLKYGLLGQKSKPLPILDCSHGALKSDEAVQKLRRYPREESAGVYPGESAKQRSIQKIPLGLHRTIRLKAKRSD